MIIPALDLLDGKVVRLYQGNYSKPLYYEINPYDRLLDYQQQGAQKLHLVDLNGAKNPRQRQINLLKKLLAQIKIPVQVGGGIRDSHDIELLLKAGAMSVVIGSQAILQPKKVQKWFNRYGGEKIVLALDIRISNDYQRKIVAIQGWVTNTEITLEEILDSFIPFGLRHVLCTDISCDGTLMGANLALYQSIIKDYPTIDFQASGGIGSLQDVLSLHNLGIQDIIIGRALLEGNFTLYEAMSC
ncbi:MAG: 1-(5-phosphoribosyl)-5-[(5-phosphoribosylamino)methylideneamino]imidazole-4-carboxamide isomerase [Candidatus Dasytiphilus stammeri]